MTSEGRVQSCIKCGGGEDLMDRGMAPGMTYCRPCRVRMSEEDARHVLSLLAACPLHRDSDARGCCSEGMAMECPRCEDYLRAVRRGDV